ncbi:MAG: DNA-binding protein, partial [Planctomycetota bacterium]
MSKSESLLEAGAWLPLKTKADEETVESLSARRYEHPALPGKTIVQIAAERTGIAEDRALDVFGFQLESTSDPLAIRRRRPMDFSGWALVTDPSNAAYALNLVKRMKKAARKARSKPGHAWDAYVEMAVELDRGACHFLPAYWEEVGITYRDLGNETYAGRSLSKAMEAERVHALPVDMKRRSDMVLEFALSGCLTIKALGDFAKDLQSLVEPEQAYEMFADLAVRRTRGGLPPWNDLGAQLKRLAKAAGVSADESLYDFVAETIDAPAIERAPIAFWRAMKKPVARLLEEKPETAARLLDLRTGSEISTWGNDLKEESDWLELLEEWGILRNVWDTSVPSELRPKSGPGGWVGRLLRGACEKMSDQIWDMLEKVTAELAGGNAGELQLTSSGQ